MAQWLARERNRGDLPGSSQFEYVPKTLTFQAANGPSQLCRLIPHDVGPKLAVSTRLIALLAQLFGQVEDDRNREHMKLSGQLDQRLTRLWLHIGRINDGEPSGG